MQSGPATTALGATLVAPSDLLTAFDYQPLTRLVFAPGALNRLGALVRSLGGTRVLLVTDPGLGATGHPQRALASLRDAGLSATLFDGVEENPTTRHVHDGLIVARRERCDFLAAIGGGSAMARHAWRLLEPNLERVLRDPTDLSARAAMQLGAHFAGSAIENSMLGACHACANPLTAHYGITHGIAIGVMLPHVVRFNSPAVAGLYYDLVHEAGLANGDLQLAGNVLADRLTQMLRAAKLPQTLRDCGVSSGILPVLAAEAAEQWTGKCNPRPAGEKELLALYEAAY